MGRRVGNGGEGKGSKAGAVGKGVGGTSMCKESEVVSNHDDDNIANNHDDNDNIDNNKQRRVHLPGSTYGNPGSVDGRRSRAKLHARPPRQKATGGYDHDSAFSNYTTEIGDHKLATVKAPAGEDCSECPAAPGGLYRAASDMFHPGLSPGRSEA